ncbi:MAG: V-type ATP synthase subunit F [Smithella sp.]|jgi:vacuolar-type H+-ATPase subunit F/Vma7
MDKIYIIGDMHTVSAFRLSGVEGVEASPEEASNRLEEIIGFKNAGIVLMTNDLTKDLQARIREINLNMQSPVIIEIHGIDDTEGFRRSAMGYISEALGISL